VAETGFMEEEARTHPELVKLMREELREYLAQLLEEFLREIKPKLDSITPKRLDPKANFQVLAAADSGSFNVVLADRLIAIITTLSVISERSNIRRIIRKPVICEQRRNESEQAFNIRVDSERETRLVELAADVVKKYDLEAMILDGPLIPRFRGAHISAIRNLVEIGEKRRIPVAGFVKRPESGYLFRNQDPEFLDSAILSACLNAGECYPWPPKKILDERTGMKFQYTYLKTTSDRRILPFRIDFPNYLDDESCKRILEHMLAITDPLKGVPAIIMMADEEVKLSKKLMRDLYAECVASLMSKYPEKSWGVVMTRWGEFWL